MKNKILELPTRLVHLGNYIKTLQVDDGIKIKDAKKFMQQVMDDFINLSTRIK